MELHDRFHVKGNWIVHLSIRYGDEPVDGRIYGFTKDSPVMAGAPGVEDAMLINKKEIS
ncbi:MAG: hypothetical protein LBC19_03790 [Tannerella sp.]|jgi:hypothetical protein|nr:hypothetical protein [Tannerella sp.]